MKRSFLLPVMLPALLALFSCEKEVSVAPSGAATKHVSNAEGFSAKIVDGRFVFADRQSAAEVLNKIAEMTPEEYDAWTKELGNGEFTTYIDQDSTVALPQLYSRILNKEGAFQVGKEVAIYSKGREYVASVDQYNEIRNSGRGYEELPSMDVSLTGFTESEEVGRNATTLNAKMASGADGTIAQRNPYTRQLQFTYDGVERKLVHEVEGFANRYFLIIEARNKFEYYRRRKFGRNTWEIESTNCHKEMSPMRLTWTSMSPFNNGPGSVNFGIPRVTWGNDTLISSFALAADGISGVRLYGSFLTEFWGNNLIENNVNWNVGSLSK